MDRQLELFALVAADRRREFLQAAQDVRLIESAGPRNGLLRRLVGALRRRGSTAPAVASLDDRRQPSHRDDQASGGRAA